MYTEMLDQTASDKFEIIVFESKEIWCNVSNMHMYHNQYSIYVLCNQLNNYIECLSNIVFHIEYFQLN